MVFMYFVELFMPYLNFEYTKAVISTVENVGGGIGHARSCNWGDPCWVIQFFPVCVVGKCGTLVVHM